MNGTLPKVADEEKDLFLERAVHDLRAAARGISLATELGIGTVVESLERLNGILDGIGRYTRATRHSEYAPEPYSTDHALNAVMQSMQKTLEDLAAKINRSDLPVVHGDPVWIRELFGILIVNSVTYRGVEPLEIRFSAHTDGEFWLFSVADNGMGVDSKYRERVFAPFQRLHGSSLPGAGLGLSTAKQIVEGHGGTIWLSDSAGPGATMQFRLPQSRTAL